MHPEHIHKHKTLNAQEPLIQWKAIISMEKTELREFKTNNISGNSFTNSPQIATVLPAPHSKPFFSHTPQQATIRN